MKWEMENSSLIFQKLIEATHKGELFYLKSNIKRSILTRKRYLLNINSMNIISPYLHFIYFH